MCGKLKEEKNVSMTRLIIVIPTLNPLPSLVPFIEKLLSFANFVIVVDDGSEKKYQAIFEELRTFTHCVVIEHETNLGKGAALKSAFSYILRKNVKTDWVLTVGAHGQHLLEEVKLILKMGGVFSDGIVIGTRYFKSKELPVFSFIGNRATSMLFELFFHKRLADVQSGLRLIPRKELSWLIKLPGESFSYDINMLVEAIRRDIPIYEVPIGRARFKKNALIHYDEIFDVAETAKQLWASFRKKKS